MSAVEHATPHALHTCVQLWYGAPRYHCGATVAVADADTPDVVLPVGVVLPLLVTVRVGELLAVAVAVAVG